MTGLKITHNLEGFRGLFQHIVNYKKSNIKKLFGFLTASFYITFFYTAYRCAWFQTGISCWMTNPDNIESMQILTTS